MTTATIMRIIDTARVNAPGALDGMLRLELFNTAKEFFRETSIWREDLNIYIDPNSYDYDLVTISKGVITELVSLGRPTNSTAGAVTTNPLPDVSGDFNNDYNADFGGTASAAASAAAYPVVLYNRNVQEKSPRRGALVRSGASDAILRIFDIPPQPEIWIAEVSLTVSDPTDGDGIPYMPNWIVEKYQDTFLDGLLARMMVHPAKPYSNKEGAAYHGRRFMNGKGTARKEARHGSIFAGQRWSFPQSFRTRSQRSY